MKKFSCRPKPSGKVIILGNAGRDHDPGYIELGRLAESGAITPVHLLTDKPIVAAIVGKRGSGKSYTLGAIVESLCARNDVSSLGKRRIRQAQFLFDTLGIFQWMGTSVTDSSNSETIRLQALAQRGWSLKQEDLNTEVWIPKGNRAEWTPNTHKDFVLSEKLMNVEDISYLLGLDITSDRMGQLLADSFAKVTQDGWNESSVNHPPAESDILNAIIKCVNSDTDISDLYAPETRRALSQQIMAMTRLGIFDETGTNLTELLKGDQLSILVMNRLSDSVRLAILTALIRAIMRSRVEASELTKQNLISGKAEGSNSSSANIIPQCWIEVDEAQNILPSERKTSATDSLVRLVREGRNYGISFAVTTQQPSSIDQRIMAQVDVLIVHKLSMQSDIDYVAKNLKSVLPDEVSYGGRILSLPDILRSLDTGQAFVSHVDSDRAYLVDIRPRVSVHGGFSI
ncbi:MAG: AAA-like domain protein [Firmicutes bacterium ADurb.Bin080]|nr:MAG: AAA-like domain protein [Firmicutes bacterium ADurb.Bin080]